MVPYMATLDLNLIREIDRLWEPVYPYLAQHIQEFYGRQEGDVLEIGPFCGVLFSLLREKIGSSFCIATFPQGMSDFFREESRHQNVEDKIKIIESDPSLTGIEENRIDLILFRGAFFFPSLFQVNLPAIYRVLRKNGKAFIGGGFGKFTPEQIIRDIGKRSRELNLRIGKVEVTEDQLRQDIEKSHMKGKAEIISDGGLWVLMKKESVPGRPDER